MTFENYSNTLSPDSIEEGIQEPSLSRGKRRSPRLQNRQENSKAAQSQSENPEPAPKLPRPRADQICMYNSGNGSSQATYINELKAPHKLPLSFICDGLGDIDLDDIICIQENETQQRQCQRLIAVVITQAFSYMIQVGLEYGCVCTGEASIFLRVRDDPGTVYYYLSVPKHDVSKTTGWTQSLDAGNPLHLTAVGQMLAFTLRALQATTRNQHWRSREINQLDRWEVSYDDLLEEIPSYDASTSEYSPTPCSTKYLRMSPIQLRKRESRGTPPGCAEKGGAVASDDEPDTDTPSGPHRQYSIPGRATQKLAGAVSDNQRRRCEGAT